MTEATIPTGIFFGHMLLKVTDVDRAVGFYRDVLGFEVRHADSSWAFLSTGVYYHHIVLQRLENASPRSERSTGLDHIAINYPTRRDLAAALKRVLDHGWNIHGAAEYGTHEAIYLRDPDFNGFELAWDSDPEAWVRDGVSFDRKSLDFEGLFAELDDPDSARYLSALAVYT